MNKFVLGDVHGGYKALLQVLKRSKFDYEKDQLVSLGDICDGWPEVPECFEELLKIKNLIYIMGNHDKWALTWMEGQMRNHLEESAWLKHGGEATKQAYLSKYDLVSKHREFLSSEANLFYLDEENRVFVHGGFDHNFHISDQAETTYYWDREFWEGMYRGRNWGEKYKEVYLGHTPTINYPQNDGSHFLPLLRRNVFNVDTGAAFSGKLTLMNIDSKEIFQSDTVRELYPDHPGRMRRSFNSEQ
jgi:serine/threonine protein phosphatase 1